ncbi:4Fe-4S ferredoxin iron-sulfur binding domain-containing protein [Desulfovibrio sp. X2]|nr:4Fe-4S ferredoxin iron-sulfur binding domain-containing protein [Desulfovibrio sp. X2]
MTLSEIAGVAGEAGNYTVKVRKAPRYVDMEKCIACGLCAEKCPKKVPNEFNQGLDNRKAAYIQYGQTVPLKYALDAENCLYLTKGKCRACEKFCPTGAINFEDKEEIVELNVGALILAPGFHPYNPGEIDFWGYDRKHLPDVVTSLEYERLLSASGPCMGHLTRPSDHSEPKKIAWLQCVGSRSSNKCDNGFCSSVCCMYAIKQALVTADHTSGDVNQTVFYMDIRSHGKEFEKYYENAKEKGIDFVRARIHTVYPGPEGKGVRVRYATEDGKEMYEDYDMLVHSIGLEAPKDARKLAEICDFQLDKYRFAATSSFAPVSTSRPGIFVSGAFQGPKDIPQSVTEASSAAAAAADLLAEAKGSLTREKTYPAERDISKEPARVGVFVCSCGINIASVVDVKKVTEYAKTLPDVVFVENNLFTCSTDTQVMIAEKIKEHGLNRIVIAACTPRTHEPLFKDTLREAGLNQYLVEMANIRNQNSWVHPDTPEKATEKAMDQVRMAVAKARLLAPLDKLSVDVVQQALVVGGGVSGMTAALGLANQGYKTYLLEKSSILGGNAWSLDHTWKGEKIVPHIEHLIAQVDNHPNITIYKNATLRSAVGSVGNFVSEIDVAGEKKAIKYGAAVVATGAKESKPTEYMYGKDPRVLTHQDFEHMMKKEPEKLDGVKSVVFIQCVGSREPARPYCSRVCCSHSVEAAVRLKDKDPNMKVFVLNRDIRTYGEREDLYTRSREKGVMYIRYEPEAKPQVTSEGGSLYVTAFDPILQAPVKLKADLLILASAIVPNETRELVDLYKCSVGTDGFLTEAHPKLRPVDLSVDGLYVAGLCHYPKPIDEAVAQAQAAVARAGVVLSRTVMPLDSIKSYVTENCDGCALCVDTCPYNAISLAAYQADDGKEHRRIQTDKALCKGCGVCMATCPKQGVNVAGFDMEQIKAQVRAALAGI